jgi:hypothetical protein
MVAVDSYPAPLWYVSPGQISFQMPWESPLAGTSNIQVYNGLGVSQPVSVTLTPYAPGIFQYYPAAGDAESVITHADYSLVTAAKPAVPGENIVVWMTGFGDVAVVPQTGFGSPLGATATTLPNGVSSGRKCDCGLRGPDVRRDRSDPGADSIAGHASGGQSSVSAGDSRRVRKPGCHVVGEATLGWCSGGRWQRILRTAPSWGCPSSS